MTFPSYEEPDVYDDAWQQVSDEAQLENADGFRAYILTASDPAFDRATWKTVKAAVPANDPGASVLSIADSTTLTSPDHQFAPYTTSVVLELECPAIRAISSTGTPELDISDTNE